MAEILVSLAILSSIILFKSEPVMAKSQIYNESSEEFSFKRLFLGILFIAGGIISFVNPKVTLGTLALYFGILAIMKGIVSMLLSFKIRIEKNYHSRPLIAVSIFDFIIGVLLLVNPVFTGIIVVYVLGIWFIIDCIVGLSTLNIAKTVSQGYFWFKLVINILGIIAGIIVLYDPKKLGIATTMVIGLYFIIFGIINFIEAFGRKKANNKF